YASYVRGRRIEHGEGGSRNRADRLARVRVAVLIALDVLLIFWTVAVYAGNTGLQYSQQLADAKLRTLPGVGVYSNAPCGLAAAGRSVTEFRPCQSQYRYPYS